VSYIKALSHEAGRNTLKSRRFQNGTFGTKVTTRPDKELCGGHADRRYRRGATLALAVPAMTSQSEHDFTSALVTDRAAQTTTGSWHEHVKEPPEVSQIMCCILR